MCRLEIAKRQACLRAFLAATLFYLICSAAASAQRVTLIDLRGKQPPPEPRVAPDEQILCAGGTAGVAPHAPRRLNATVSITDPGNLATGGLMDYEVMVRNDSLEDISIPQSVERSDVVERGQKLQNFQTATITFFVQPESAPGANFDAGFILYGKPARPSTMVVLHAGDAVRIVGSAAVKPVWSASAPAPQQGSGMRTQLSGKLYAYFAMHREEVRKSKHPECHGYEAVSNQLLSIKSDNGIKVIIRAEPQP